MRRPTVETRPHCGTCSRTNVVLTTDRKGGPVVTVCWAVWPYEVQAGVAAVNALLDACDESPMWAAELSDMADSYARNVTQGASAETAAALREAAAAPPDSEDAFRFRLCVLLNLHPRLDRRDLDNAVARARARFAHALTT